jgi:hypothetical protein
VSEEEWICICASLFVEVMGASHLMDGFRNHRRISLAESLQKIYRMSVDVTCSNESLDV